jgi:hypothetical protein
MLLVANLGPRAQLSALAKTIYGPNVAFYQITNTPAFSVFSDLVGIVWDNNLVGYIYGFGRVPGRPGVKRCIPCES